MIAIRVCLLTLLFALPGCALAPERSAAYSFAFMGDMPYSYAQANLLDSLIDRVNAEPLAFAAHVGDITSGQGPCGDDLLLERKRQFERFRTPFVLLPGDNDWTDCHRTGFDPMERLAKWRQLFCIPVDVPGFVAAQLLGAALATLLFRWLVPAHTPQRLRSSACLGCVLRPR